MPIDPTARGIAASALAAVTGGTMTNPMTTAGDLVIGGAAGVPQRLGIGSTGQLLTAGVAPAWSGASLTFSTTTNTLTINGAPLTGDAANILAQVNGTNAQSLRVYNTSSSANANYERAIFGWTDSSNVLTIGTQNAGTGVARNFQLVAGGTNVFDYGVTTPNIFTLTTGVDNFSLNVVCTAGVNYSGGVTSYSPTMSAGNRVIGYDAGVSGTNYNSGGYNFYYVGSGSTSNAIEFGLYNANSLLNITGSGLITFSGYTSSYPALLRSGTTLKVRLADNSGDAPLVAASFGTSSATLLSGQASGYGTPTGGSHQSSFAAGSITLPNLAACVAQLIVDLKAGNMPAT